MACTSFPHHGRDHLRSHKLHRLLPTGWLILTAPCCPIPSILTNSDISTLEAPNEKDMYSSCILIISIKHLCFTPCVLSRYHSFSMFYHRQAVDHHPFLNSWSQHHLRVIPMRARDPLSRPRVVGGRSLVWPVCSHAYTGSVPRSQTTYLARAVWI
jgi:hypothetical protein